MPKSKTPSRTSDSQGKALRASGGAAEASPRRKAQKNSSPSIARRATPAPRRHEELLPLLLDNLPEHALCLVDDAGQLLTWNGSAEKIYGHPTDEIVGASLETLLPTEHQGKGLVVKLLDTARREGRAEEEGCHRRKDGSKFWADVVVNRLAKTDAAPAAFSMVVRDLTAKRAKEQELRESEERFRLLVEAVKDYAIFMLDPKGHILTWNAGAERFKGYKPAEIIGKHFSTFYPEADIKAGKTEWELEVAEREGRFEDEGWRVRKDGSLFWANVIITALRNARGELVGFAKVTRDLTEKRNAQEALRQSEERLRLLVSSVKDYAIFMLDATGHVQTWNQGAERIKGYTAKEIVGQSIKRFYTPEDLAAGRPERLLRTAEREGRVEDEGFRVRKDGTRFWADVVITAVKGPDGTLRGFAKVTRDLTDRHAAEQERLKRVQAEESVRLRDEFLSIASHELKTPLTALRLQMESMALGASAQDEKTLKRLERATRSADRLVELVETLLDVSRIATGKMSLRAEEVNFGELVRGVVDRLGSSAEAANCSVTIHGEGDAQVHWDRLRMEQVVTNLLGNAFRYAAGTPVTLHLSTRPDEVVLVVADRGPGIAEAARERIFGRFERASSSRHYGGLGLGLYVSREIVEAHGGEITASNLEGGGAEFRITLPRVAKLRPPAEGKPQAEPA